MKLLSFLSLAGVLLVAGRARAVEIKVTSSALERTLNKQLFTDNGRHYIRGKVDSACYVYTEAPTVTFKDDRIWVHVRTHSKLGATVGHSCLGVSLTADADVSMVPDAQGESVGFRDARVEHLSTNSELNVFIVPFLNGKLPQQMKVNVAEQVRQLLKQSGPSIGYDITLDELKIHSMQINKTNLEVDFDSTISVQ